MAVFLAIFFSFFRTTSPTRPTDALKWTKAKGQVLKSVAGMDLDSGNKDQNLKQNQCYLCNNRLPKLLIRQMFYGVLAFAAPFQIIYIDL